MKRTVEFSPELEAQLERAAAQLQTNVPSFVEEAVREKIARVFDEARFKRLTGLDAVEALDRLLQLPPYHRAAEGVEPSDDVALFYKNEAESLKQQLLLLFEPPVGTSTTMQIISLFGFLLHLRRRDVVSVDVCLIDQTAQLCLCSDEELSQESLIGCFGFSSRHTKTLVRCIMFFDKKCDVHGGI